MRKAAGNEMILVGGVPSFSRIKQDDNVHFLSTLHLLTALQKNKKHFQFMLYPGGNHSLQGTGNPLVYFHLFQTLTDFVSENL